MSNHDVILIVAPHPDDETLDALRAAGSEADLLEYFLALKRGMTVADVPARIVEVELGERRLRGVSVSGRAVHRS